MRYHGRDATSFNFTANKISKMPTPKISLKPSLPFNLPTVVPTPYLFCTELL